MPQSPVVVSGPKEEIDATEWWSKTVTHCITGSGFTLRIAFKKKPNRATLSASAIMIQRKASPA
jgi:Phage late control gene D protein (GPD).